jgi:hypothetical protein
MMTIDSKNSLYTYSHFTEHLMHAFGKPPQENDLNHETSSLLIRRLKDTTGTQINQLKLGNKTLHHLMGISSDTCSA